MQQWQVEYRDGRGAQQVKRAGLTDDDGAQGGLAGELAGDDKGAADVAVADVVLDHEQRDGRHVDASSSRRPSRRDGRRRESAGGPRAPRSMPETAPVGRPVSEGGDGVGELPDVVLVDEPGVLAVGERLGHPLVAGHDAGAGGGHRLKQRERLAFHVAVGRGDQGL